MRWNVDPSATSDARIGRQECIQRRMIPPANHEPASVHRPGVSSTTSTLLLFSLLLSLSIYCSVLLHYSTSPTPDSISPYSRPSFLFLLLSLLSFILFCLFSFFKLISC